MLYNYTMLALCMSIDSLGTGITYGIKNTSFSFQAKVILYICSFLTTLISLLIGKTISGFFSSFLSSLIGGIILCIMGLWFIFQGPEHTDIDNSNNIDLKEAILLAITLSLDSIGISIGGGIIGFSSIYFPILASTFQILLLSLGIFLGNKLKNSHNIPPNVWSIIAGLILICIGLSRIF